MIQDGQIVLFAFPHTNQSMGKLRPALILRALPGPQDDWLICMISTQLHHEVPGVDEVIHDTDPDFSQTGLKMTSLVRVLRIAVVSADLLRGAVGNIAEQRLARIRICLAQWISGFASASVGEKNESTNPKDSQE